MNEAELLFTERLNCDRPSLYLNKDKILSQDNSAFISGVLKRRISGEPVQYILGKTEFMGLEFKVNKDVFIPRQETEVLVEKAISLVSECQSARVSGVNILDIGTGSGCIAVSLAKFLPNAKVDTLDISTKALNIARENARINKVEGKITFLKSNLFESLALCTLPYALCIANPPYIPSVEIGKLQPEIQYEPRIALDGGKDGLDFYRRIIKDAPGYLKEDGLLIMEMGFGQSQEIKNILENSGNFWILEVVKDYNGIERVMVAQWTN